MKTHISNTKAIELYTSYDGKIAYANHQQALHSQKIKPMVDTRRKTQYKIVNNNKVQLNTQPTKLVNKLYKNITEGKYKSTIDNRVPGCYENGKKILKDKIKRSPKEAFIQKQHERELRSQADRVKNCKSMGQRKKDNYDPIVKPTYFMREGDESKSVTIEAYKKTVLTKNRPVSAAPTSTQVHLQTHTVNPSLQPAFNPALTSVPNMSKSAYKPPKPQSAGQHRPQHQHNSEDLPELTFKALLEYIVDNKLYKEVDMRVLYVRLCHRYGDERVDDVWGDLMDELEK